MKKLGRPRKTVGTKKSIERRYGASIQTVVAMLDKQYRNLDAVADELNTSRQSLYNWLGSAEIAMLKAQAGMANHRESQETVSVGY